MKRKISRASEASASKRPPMMRTKIRESLPEFEDSDDEYKPPQARIFLPSITVGSSSESSASSSPSPSISTSPSLSPSRSSSSSPELIEPPQAPTPPETPAPTPPESRASAQIETSAPKPLETPTPSIPKPRTSARHEVPAPQKFLVIKPEKFLVLKETQTSLINNLQRLIENQDKFVAAVQLGFDNIFKINQEMLQSLK